MEPGGSIPHSQGLSNNPYPGSEALSDVSEQRWLFSCYYVRHNIKYKNKNALLLTPADNLN